MNPSQIDEHSGQIALSDAEGVKKILVTTILGLWDAVNNLTRIKPTRRDRYRVTIFGSARCGARQLRL